MSTSNLKQIIRQTSTFYSIRWVCAFIARRYITHRFHRRRRVLLRHVCQPAFDKVRNWSSRKSVDKTLQRYGTNQQHAKPACPWVAYATQTLQPQRMKKRSSSVWDALRQQAGAVDEANSEEGFRVMRDHFDLFGPFDYGRSNSEPFHHESVPPSVNLYQKCKKLDPKRQQTSVRRTCWK